MTAPTHEQIATTRAMFASHARDFLSSWEHGPLALMITGGGLSFLDIGKLPGASSVLASAHVPYHQLDAIAYAGFGLEEGSPNPLTSGIPFCSAEATEVYSWALQRRSQPIAGAVQVVINASVTTNRWRRGENEAWVWIRNHPQHQENGHIIRLRIKIPKLTENEYASFKSLAPERLRFLREWEDMKIAAIVMSELMDDDTFDIQFDGVTVEQVEEVSIDAHA